MSLPRQFPGKFSPSHCARFGWVTSARPRRLKGSSLEHELLRPKKRNLWSTGHSERRGFSWECLIHTALGVCVQFWSLKKDDHNCHQTHHTLRTGKSKVSVHRYAFTKNLINYRDILWTGWKYILCSKVCTESCKNIPARFQEWLAEMLHHSAHLRMILET